MAVPVVSLAPDIKISRLCLGTMTFGEQNTVSQSFQLLDQAFHAGINFFDSAKMYPVPQRKETQGRSEEYVGKWIKEKKMSRDKVVLATKVSGPSGQMTWIRGGPKSLDYSNISEAIDGSLMRMSTDYIDLYQIHWPDRYVPMFGETEYDPSWQYESVGIEEQLHSLGRAIDAGKIRYIGLSNETLYGVMKFLHLAKNTCIENKILTLQNSYNLLCRNLDAGLAECCHHERLQVQFLVALLYFDFFPIFAFVYSLFRLEQPNFLQFLEPPLLFRGRYSEGESRYKLFSPGVIEAVKEYVDLARNYGLSPTSLAIAFVLSHPLIASAIFGATKPCQLAEIIEASNAHLTSEILSEINKIHSRYPNPCP